MKAAARGAALVLALGASPAAPLEAPSGQVLLAQTAPRAQAMGGACAAARGDLGPLFCNPAGLAGFKGPEAAASQFLFPGGEFDGETRLRGGWFGAGAGLPKKGGTFAAGATLARLEYPSFDATGGWSGLSSQSDVAVRLAYARPLSGALRAGAALQFLKEELMADQSGETRSPQAKGKAWALDAGVQSERGPWKLGAFLYGLGLGRWTLEGYPDGSGEADLKLAQGLRLGAARELEGPGAKAVLLAADLDLPLYLRGVSVRLGAEVRPSRHLGIRAGVSAARLKGFGWGVTPSMGLDLRVGRIAFFAAYDLDAFQNRFTTGQIGIVGYPFED